MVRLLFSLSLILCSLSSFAQIFYEISGNGIERSSYIFGTHHLMKYEMIDPDSVVLSHLNNVDAIIGEIDFGNGKIELAAKMTPYMTVPTDSTLSKVLDQTTLNTLDSLISSPELSRGAMVKLLDSMKPLSAGILLMQVLVSKMMPESIPAEGEQIDMLVQTKGKLSGKLTGGLETVEEQCEAVFNSSSIARQAADLKELVDDPEKALKILHELNNAYLNEDIQTMERISQRETDADIDEIILKKRNESWLAKIPVIMSESPAMFVIGAGHLPGKDGIITSLSRQGYTVKPIYLRKRK